MSFTTVACSIKGNSIQHWPAFKKIEAGEIRGDQARVSLVREVRQHAILIVEYMNDEGIPQAKKVHLRGTSFIKKPLQLFTDPKFAWVGYYRRGTVEIIDLSEKDIRCKEICNQWTVDKADALHLLARVENEKNSYFNILGSGAISSSIASTLFNQRSNNCFTWAREKLMMVGVNIDPRHHWKPIEITKLATQKMRVESMDTSIRPLCHFARSNDVRSIERWYKDNPLVNGFGWRETKGPCEFVLGKYSPLMLAAAYGKTKAVNYLVHTLKANPYINARARFGFGLLGRYSAFDCGQSLLFRSYVGKAQQKKVCDSLSRIDHKEFMRDALERYVKSCKAETSEYAQKISFFGINLINFGCSKTQQIAAAQAYTAWLDNPDVDLTPHSKALHQGALGKMVADYQKHGLKPLPANDGPLIQPASLS